MGPTIIHLHQSSGKKKPKNRSGKKKKQVVIDSDEEEDDFDIKGNSQFNSLMSRFFKAVLKEDGSRDDHDGETKAQKTARLVKRKFLKGDYVHLGALALESDPNFKEPSTQIHLSNLTSLKAKQKYVLPKTWPDFVLLFVRLLKGYICNGFGCKAAVLFEYLEKLTILHNVNTCSVTALIHYDDRVRLLATTPFGWLKFDHQLFEVVRAEFPLVSPAASASNSHSQGGSGKRSTPFSKSARTKHGQCSGWAHKGSCKFEKSNSGCRFAHWCVNPECVKTEKVDHKPSECPNKGD